MRLLLSRGWSAKHSLGFLNACRLGCLEPEIEFSVRNSHSTSPGEYSTHHYLVREVPFFHFDPVLADYYPPTACCRRKPGSHRQLRGANLRDSRATLSSLSNDSKIIFPPKGRTVAHPMFRIALSFTLEFRAAVLSSIIRTICISKLPFLFMLRVNATRDAAAEYSLSSSLQGLHAYAPRHRDFRKHFPRGCPRWVSVLPLAANQTA